MRVAFPHAQSEGENPQASHLPIGQDSIPSVLLDVLLCQQLVSSIGEGLSHFEN